MSRNKKRALETLKSGINSTGKAAESRDLNGFKRLCAAWTSTGDQKERERRIKKIVRQETGLAEMLRQNDDILTADLERAMLELATGCTVTETRTRVSSGGGKTVERIERQLPPNQSAAEFLLTNRAPERFTKNPQPVSEGGEGRISEILEALKNVR